MNPIKALINYVRSSIAELKKVTWPTRQETIRYTILVTAVSLFVAIFFASMDFGLGKLVDATLLRPQFVNVQQNIPDAQVIPDLEGVDADGNIQVDVLDSEPFIPSDLQVETEPVDNPIQ